MKPLDLDNIVTLASKLSQQQDQVSKIEKHLEDARRRELQLVDRLQRGMGGFGADVELVIRIAGEVTKTREAIVGLLRNLDDATQRCEEPRDALRRAVEGATK